MRQRRQADHRGGVTGEHETIRTKVAIARCTCRTEPDPQRQTTEERHRILCEQCHQQHHHGRARQRSEQPVKTLGEHLPALRLHDDENSDHRRPRLGQLKAQRQPIRQECGDQYLADIDPGYAVAARPTVELTTPGQRDNSMSKRGHISGRPSCPFQQKPRVHRFPPTTRHPAPPPVRRRRSGAQPRPAAEPVVDETAGSGR